MKLSQWLNEKFISSGKLRLGTSYHYVELIQNPSPRDLQTDARGFITPDGNLYTLKTETDKVVPLHQDIVDYLRDHNIYKILSDDRVDLAWNASPKFGIPVQRVGNTSRIGLGEIYEIEWVQENAVKNKQLNALLKKAKQKNPTFMFVKKMVWAIKEGINEQQSVRRAGLIPYTEENGKLYFALMIPSNPKYGGSKPQIAKGQIEGNDSPLQTAVREAEEELGYIHNPTYNIRVAWQGHGGKMNFYYVKVKDRNFDKPHFETKEVVWLEENEALNQIRDWQAFILKIAIRKIKQGIE